METLDNWKTLLQFLPEGWDEKAKDLGALTRQRKIQSPEVLLRVLLIHLADGCSLRETILRAKKANLADISDVALLKRLRSSSEWLRWLSSSMLGMLGGTVKKPSWLADFNVRIVDASVITEPGSTGSDWRLHYSIELFGLKCDHLKITQPDQGESFKNYFIQKGDLLIGDRAYGSKVGITYIMEREGDFLVRIKNKAMTLMKSTIEVFDLLKNFRELEIGEVGDWDVLYSPSKDKWQKIRLCAIKKSSEAAEYSIKKAKQNMIKKQIILSEETLELHKYFFVITSVKREVLAAEEIMSLYRLRWQILSASFCYAHLLLQNFGFTANSTGSEIKRCA